MYSPKIYPGQVKRLYRLKMSRLAKGEKGITMVDLVAEALNEYLPKQEKYHRENGGLLLIGEPPANEHEKAIPRS